MNNWKLQICLLKHFIEYLVCIYNCWLLESKDCDDNKKIIKWQMKNVRANWRFNNVRKTQYKRCSIIFAPKCTLTSVNNWLSERQKLFFRPFVYVVSLRYCNVSRTEEVALRLKLNICSFRQFYCYIIARSGWTLMNSVMATVMMVMKIVFSSDVNKYVWMMI